ncbi:ABC transporter substrate-binding protein [Microlunatus soli]|uniref:ABC-type glycerol-3-phosphate transport system, substrate-binding protein n=1 Tax=Microlunatus soli TaxID=630515 RepID=A0A1H1TVV3_9ACTN|nr:sugar ABC transporter substrate-binding protein [Microlunatus soli]SDS64328.1 ABC-type glycerol-3-phosphate transport system, substrate-binding protein [Microlunatus soli]
MSTTARSPLSRRRFLAAAGIAAGMAAATGCAKGTGTVAATKNTITSAAWVDPITDVIYGPIAKGFAAKSGVTLQPQASVAFADYQTRWRTLLAGGQPPDILEVNDDFVAEVTNKKLTQDLTPYLQKSKINTSDFFEKPFNFTKRGDTQRAMSIGSLARCIIYNKTMFKEEGIPLPPTTWTDDGWKWDDFLSAAKALTKGSTTWGAVVVKDTAYENTFCLNNGGVGTFSADGKKFTLADGPGVEALQWVYDLTLKHKVTPAYGDIQADGAEQRLFAGGKLGMLFAPSSAIAYYAENVKDFEWDIAPVPGNQHQFQEGGQIVYTIPEKAKNPDHAWDFLNYIISPEGGKVLAEAGLVVPINKKAAESLTSPGKYPKNIKLFVDAQDHSKPINFSAGTAAAVAIYRPQLQRAITGEITAKQALTAARSQVEAALAST